jgi:uncharacterized membrane protein HdeD (DUF308 family)
MATSIQLPKVRLPLDKSSWGKLMGFGILLIVLGLLSIAYTTLATLISIIILGFLLSLGGIVIIYDTIHFWWGRWSGFSLHLLTGTLYFIAGLILINNPLMASVSLTLLIGIFYVVIGIIRLINGFNTLLPNKTWRIVNGIISLLLGVLILSGWPASSLFIIGLFVGIDLLIFGWIYVMTALSAKNSMTTGNQV